MRAVARILILFVAMLSLGGCYKHVVNTHGVTSQPYEVHEPNLPAEPQPRTSKQIETREYPK